MFTSNLSDMKKSWGALVLYTISIALPIALVARNIQFTNSLVLFFVLVTLVVFPGVMTVITFIPKTSWIERIVLGAVLGFGLLSLGGFISGWTNVFLLRFLPQLIVVIVVFFVARRNRFKLWRQALKPKETSTPIFPILLGSALGSLALLSSVLTTISSQDVNWTESWGYYVDLPWQIAIVGEVGQRNPLFFPYVSGTPLAYPFGFHSAMGVLESATSISAAKFVLQIWPLFYFLLLPALTATVTSKFTNSKKAIVLSPLLIALFSGFQLGSGSLFSWFPQYSISPTLEYSALFVLAASWLLGVIEESPTSRKSIWIYVLLAFFSFGATSAKGSAWAIILLFGVLLLITNVLFKKTWKSELFAIISIVLGISLALKLVVKTTGGLTLNLVKVFPLDNQNIVLVISVAVIGIWGISSGLIAQLLKIRNFNLVSSGLFIITFAAGASLVLEHPGKSEIYFYLSAVPIFIICLSVVIAELFDRQGFVFFVPFLAFYILWQVLQIFINDNSLWVFCGLAIIAIGLAAILAISPHLNLTNTSKKFQVVFVICTLLISTFGLQKFELKAPTFSGYEFEDSISIQKDELELLSKLKEASAPEDLVATNLHCINSTVITMGATENCDSRSFSISAFAERRVLVEGWSYTPNGRTFWNPEKLFSNDTFFLKPSEELASKLRKSGVSWLISANSEEPSQDISKYAESVMSNSYGTLWKLTK